MNLKHCEIVTDVDKLKVDLQSTFMKYSTIKSWAYIIHDKDDTRPHYHIYLHFGGASVNLSQVASWFEVDEQFVCKIKGRKTDALKYLLHMNSSQKNKHQYDPSEIHANFDVMLEIEQSAIIGNFSKYSYIEQLKYINSLDVDDRTKAYAQLKKHYELFCQSQILQTERSIEVHFITGCSGSGKSTYAKKMLETLNLSYCISSSSNDPLQDYLGQDAIILDDFRDNVFELADLLKFLDPYVASSVKSRFSNKVFVGKMIVITSCEPLSQWYWGYKTKIYDTLEQLYRRFNSYIVVDKNIISIYDKIDNKGRPLGLARVFNNNLFSNGEKLKSSVKYDICGAFSKICSEVDINIPPQQLTFKV